VLNFLMTFSHLNCSVSVSLFVMVCWEKTLITLLLLSLFCRRVVDDDGEFLLIEAAGSIPKWANPDTAENRVCRYTMKLL